MRQLFCILLLLLPLLSHAQVACDTGMMARAQQQLGIAANTPDLRTACKALPSDPGMAAIAFYLPQPRRDGIWYDLNLAVVDARGQVLAQAQEPKSAFADLVALEEVAIDAGPYTLAPGARAFAVTTRNALRCADCGMAETFGGLWVKEGDRLRKVLDGYIPLVSGRDYSDPACSSATMAIHRSITIGQARPGSYANLTINALTLHQPGRRKDGTVCGGGEPERERETWIYDGNQYHPLR